MQHNYCKEYPQQDKLKKSEVTLDNIIAEIMDMDAYPKYDRHL